MRLRAATVLAAALLAACGWRTPTADDLQLPADTAGLDRVLVRAVWTEDGAQDASRADAAVARAMRQRRIHSSGNFHYLRTSAERPVFKVRIDVFTDRAAAEKDWDQRHLPQMVALLQPLALPDTDQAWIYRNQMTGFRIGQTIVEIRAEGAAPLEAFTRQYAAFLVDELPAAD